MYEEALPYFIFSVWAVLALYIAISRGGLRRIYPRDERPLAAVFVPLTLAAFFLYILFQGVLIPLIARLFICKEDICIASNGLLTIISDIGIVASALAVTALSLLPPIRHTIWGEGNYLVKFLRGARWWLFVYPIAVIFSSIIKLILHLLVDYSVSTQVAVDFLMKLLDNPWLFYLNGFLVAFVVPVSEELLFRGFLYNALKGFLSIKVAIVLSALCFSLFHFDVSQSITNIELISVIFLLGLVLAWVYEREKSIWASIGLHATFNFVSILSIMFEK
ncbi:MAG: type II CAAX endopeptidase family protein [Parachlamydiales bacterium]|jgi:membrane protease YdiL (CAAX protease family)